VTDVLSQYDQNGDGVVSFEEYRTYVRRTERAMREAFARLDLDGRGHATPEGVLTELHRIGIKARWQDAHRMVQLIDADGDGRVSYSEWQRFVTLLPAAQVKENAAWALMASAVDLPPTTQPTSEILKKLAIGAFAGAVAKCFVAPFERLREVLQAAEVVPPSGLAGVTRQIIRDEGVRGLWRGNTLVLARVVPYVALQWSIYDAVQDALALARQRGTSTSAPPVGCSPQTGVLDKLVAGIVAGTAATLVVYPLECLKTEVAVAGLRGSLIANARQVLREEGIRGFYKGLGATVSFKVIATAVGFNLHAELSKAYRQAVDGRRLTALEHGLIGGLSGVVCATITLPLHSAVTKLRIQGTAGRPVLYRGLADCMRQTARKAGVRALFSGALPTYAKVFPNVAIVYGVTAACRRRWGVGGLSVYGRPPRESSGKATA
jgi:solute carrier family 25 phosphate transporter 23/24/25/41